jgi:hypothetical protein
MSSEMFGAYKQELCARIQSCKCSARLVATFDDVSRQL